MLSAMALCRGGSKDPRKNDKKDKNNNFNKKIQKLLSAITFCSHLIQLAELVCVLIQVQHKE